MILGLDINTHLVAWAIIDSRRVPNSFGYVEVGDHDRLWVVEESLRRIRLVMAGCIPVVGIEVHDHPSNAIPSIKNYRRARWMEGRMLQALYVDEPIEVQASSEPKKIRRRRMEMKYGIRRDRGEIFTEDEIDALAVADKACEVSLVNNLRRKAAKK